MKSKLFCLIVSCVVLLSGCMLLNGRGSPEDLEAWDRQREYDPASGRWYHTGTPGRDMVVGGYDARQYE